MKRENHFEANFEINNAYFILKIAYHLKPICTQLYEKLFISFYYNIRASIEDQFIFSLKSLRRNNIDW
jgi:hypothetical protein